MSHESDSFIVELPLLNGDTDTPAKVTRLQGEVDEIYHPKSRELELDKYSGEPLPIDSWDVIRRNSVDAIASSDHIQICSHLKTYADSDQTITNQELIDLLGADNAPTRTGDVYDRFKFVWCGTIGKGKKKQKTWYVEDFNPIKHRIKKRANK